MTYLTDFEFVSNAAEANVISQEKRTCFNTFYPFGIFADKGLGRIDFEPVTILYGGNGSGKSTALNVIAARLGLLRDLSFAPTEHFAPYVKLTDYNRARYEDDKGIPSGSRLVASEDVFDRTLALRQANEEINQRRGEASREWKSLKFGASKRIRSINDENFEDWKRQVSARRHKSMSSWIRDEVGMNLKTGSNGENAFEHFMEKIKPDCLYLLDEPENSMSACWQRKLADYIYGLARFENCQFVIATHSPFILGMPYAKIIDLDTLNCPVRKWTELENVREYYSFFKAHESEF